MAFKSLLCCTKKNDFLSIAKGRSDIAPREAMEIQADEPRAGGVKMKMELEASCALSWRVSVPSLILSCCIK